MRTRILRELREACAPDEPLTETTSFSDISLDSLSYVALAVRLETELGFEFEEEALDPAYWNDLGEFITYVEEHAHGEEDPAKAAEHPSL